MNGPPAAHVLVLLGSDAASIGYLICFIVRYEHLSTAPTLAVFNMCLLLKTEARRLGYYYFHPCRGYNVCRIEKAPPIWKRKFILVEIADWPFSTVPCTPLLGRLNIPMDCIFRAPLWWFSETRGSIPFFYNVVDLGALGEHDAARVRHPRRALDISSTCMDGWLKCGGAMIDDDEPAAAESGSNLEGDETTGVA
ncbi:hypothetical protein Dimus_022878 [Dionaea muscipula]